MLKLLALLAQLMAVLGPFLNSTNLALIDAAVLKVITDFKSGDYAALVADLAAALKIVVPQASAEIDAAVAKSA